MYEKEEEKEEEDREPVNQVTMKDEQRAKSREQRAANDYLTASGYTLLPGW